MTCRREVPLADRLQIPGDLAVDHLGPQPILVDLTFIHPLAPGQPRSVELCKRALVDAEQQKLDRYAVNWVGLVLSHFAHSTPRHVNRENLLHRGFRTLLAPLGGLRPSGSSN